MAAPRHWEDADLERLRDAQRVRSRLAQVGELLARLSPRQREAWLLHQMGYTCSQGAAILGVTRGCFGSYVQRARRKRDRDG